MGEGMKTLDEIITVCENQAVISSSDLDGALHYLCEYRACIKHMEYVQDLKDKLQKTIDRHITALKELEIGLINNPLTWDELFCLEMIGRPVWSEEKRGWMLLIDSALENRSWVDLVDSSGKIIRLGPHDLGKYQLYKREKK